MQKVIKLKQLQKNNMKKLFLTNQQIISESSVSFNSELKNDDRLLMSGVSLITVLEGNSLEGNSIEESLRKTCDKDIEIFVEGVSVGFGAQNFGLGQTPEQFEKAAETPESD